MKIPSSILAGLFAAASALAAAPTAEPRHAGSVWIEAENMEANNFPSPDENPFRPTQLWEKEALSAGAWMGMRWEDPTTQPSLAIDFVIGEPGEYRLYARKFFSYGNFRWRVDDGDWVSMEPGEQSSLDWDVFPENPDRIALNWYFMGSTPLEAGPHRLVVEPIYEEARETEGVPNPVAFDAFLVTRDLFFPSGKLKPGERYGVQRSEAFSFEPGMDPFAESPIDLRGLNEPFAGSEGGIVAKDGGFAFRDSGKSVRLVAVSTYAGVLADTQGVSYFARFLAKRGFNMVRIDVADVLRVKATESGELDVEVNERLLDRLLEAVVIFKAEGIYTALTWNPGRTPGIAAALFGRPQPGPGVDLGAEALFRADMVACQKTFWREILEAELPSGVPLGRDPALAMVTLLQQVSVFSHSFLPDPESRAATYNALRRAFGQWLEKSHGSLENARSAWGAEAALPEDDWDEGAPGVLDAASIAARGSEDARARDTTRFLAEHQRRFAAEMTDYLKKEAGFRGLVSFSNKTPSESAVLGFPNAWAAAPTDLVERLFLFNGMFEGGHSPWQMFPGDRFSERCAIRLEGTGCGGAADFPLRALAYDGKPYFLSEVNWPEPNRYRGEMPLVTFTLASLQGIDGVGFGFTWVMHWQNFTANYRMPVFTPAVMAQMPAFAVAYRKGYLPSGELTAKLSLTSDDIFSLRNHPLHEPPDSQIDAPAESATTDDNETVPATLAGLLVGEARVELDADHSTFETPGTPAFDGAAIEAGDGAVVWNILDGDLVVDTPRFQAAGGFLSRKGAFDLRDVSFESGMEFGVVAIVSLDGEPLDFSRKMLVQVFSSEEPLDRYAEGGAVKTLRSIGRPPMMVGNFSGRLRFNRPDASRLVATALDENGYPLVTAGLGGELSLLPTVLYYLVEKQ